MTVEKSEDWCFEIQKLEKLLPSSKANFRRLSSLIGSSDEPKIAVFGKYNHGKSTLLNALVGDDVFSVADKRETVEISMHSHNQVAWIDTPGLDADVKGDDDRLAMAAAMEKADILCLVHNVKAGELDRSEMQIYKNLMRQDNNYRSKLVLVLSQIDQVTAEDMDRVVIEIERQLPDLQMVKVSSHRYMRGIREGKDGFVKASGVPEFLAYLGGLKKDLDELRKKEARRLIRKARFEFAEMLQDRKSALVTAECELAGYAEQFWADMKSARNKVYLRAVELGLK